VYFREVKAVEGFDVFFILIDDGGDRFFELSHIREFYGDAFHAKGDLRLDFRDIHFPD
jgi:hypothetical protein